MAATSRGSMLRSVSCDFVLKEHMITTHTGKKDSEVWSDLPLPLSIRCRDVQMLDVSAHVPFKSFPSLHLSLAIPDMK